MLGYSARLRVDEFIRVQLALTEKDFDAQYSLRDDLGADSLDIMDLILAVEGEFYVEVDDERLAQVQTVGDLYQLVEELTQAPE